MKRIKNIILSKKTFALFLLISLTISFPGCKKATEYVHDNIYDRYYKGTRNGGFTFSSSIIHETQTADGLIGDGESVYYKVVITSTGPDPISYTPSFKFTHNYTGSGMTFSQSAAGPQSDLVNGFLIEPNTTVTPYYAYGTVAGKQYSFRIGKASSWVTSGTQITVTCRGYDADGNERVLGSFVAQVL